LFGTAVAATVGKGIIQPEFSTVYVIFAGLIGAIVWDLITWYFGLPSSSSHALIGGLIGSGLIAGGIKAIVISGVEKALIFMIVSPMLVLELRLLSLLRCCIFCVRRDLQR
jgi:PiT family inorganic phosphate transporter